VRREDRVFSRNPEAFRSKQTAGPDPYCEGRVGAAISTNELFARQRHYRRGPALHQEDPGLFVRPAQARRAPGAARHTASDDDLHWFSLPQGHDLLPTAARRKHGPSTVRGYWNRGPAGTRKNTSPDRKIYRAGTKFSSAPRRASAANGRIPDLRFGDAEGRDLAASPGGLYTRMGQANISAPCVAGGSSPALA
jgi:hypothetical protein